MAAAPASSAAVITAILCFLSLNRQSIGAGAGVSLCAVSSCGGRDTSFPLEVRFPFRLNTQQDDPRCGYSPDFDLSCDGFGNTVLALPGAGDFAVSSINYQTQTILLSDVITYCLPGRLLKNPSFLSGSPVFRPMTPRSFTLLNCSDDAMRAVTVPSALIVPCLSEGNYTVMSVPSRWYNGSQSCEVLGDILFPLGQSYWSYLETDIGLTWKDPDCRSCEEGGGFCRFKNDNGSEIGCTGASTSGLPRAAKYGLVLGAGIPGLLCVVGLACFIRRKVQIYRQRPRTSINFSALTVPHPTLLSVGLDMPTIQSYPKTELGESKRLPKPSDNTCSICLCEYLPKETLRTIPECNHYYHMECIDEWLRLNATCPLCRKSPEASSLATSSSSLSLTSVTSSV